MENFNLSSSLSSSSESDSLNYSFLGVDHKSFDLLPLELQTEYAKQASNYIARTIPGWGKNQPSKIVGIAKMIHRWNVSDSPKAMLKFIETEIRDVNKFIERRKKMSLPYEDYLKQLESLSALHAETKKKCQGLS